MNDTSLDAAWNIFISHLSRVTGRKWNSCHIKKNGISSRFLQSSSKDSRSWDRLDSFLQEERNGLYWPRWRCHTDRAPTSRQSHICNQSAKSFQMFRRKWEWWSHLCLCPICTLGVLLEGPVDTLVSCSASIGRTFRSEGRSTLQGRGLAVPEARNLPRKSEELTKTPNISGRHHTFLLEGAKHIRNPALPRTN